MIDLSAAWVTQAPLQTATHASRVLLNLEISFILTKPYVFPGPREHAMSILPSSRGLRAELFFEFIDRRRCWPRPL